jgi:hypothetical protein
MTAREQKQEKDLIYGILIIVIVDMDRIRFIEFTSPSQWFAVFNSREKTLDSFGWVHLAETITVTDYATIIFILIDDIHINGMTNQMITHIRRRYTIYYTTKNIIILSE